MTPELKQSAARLVEWTRDAALPLWAEVQEPTGAWPEDLHLDGSPNTQAVRRHRVQARQAYTYALATHLGWGDWREVALRTLRFMWEAGSQPEGTPGLAHRLHPDGTVESAKRDLYDHAFYLLASAWVEHVVDWDQAARPSANLKRFLQSLAHPSGGYREGLPDSPFRRQNPHMHLFEVALHLRELGADAGGPDAKTLYALFETHFFDPGLGAVREYFDKDWTPQSTPFEPGHAVEWVWLLGWWQRLTGTPTQFYRDALYGSALRSGSVWLYDEVVPGQHTLWEAERETSRLWVQTELIKAHLTQGEHGDRPALGMAAAAIDGLLSEWLEPRGTWVDKRGACGQRLSDTIPTSTFYHIIGAAAEADRVAKITR